MSTATKRRPTRSRGFRTAISVNRALQAGVVAACFLSSDVTRLSAGEQKTEGTSRNRPPVADPGGPYAGIPARDVLFSATRSTDPDSDSLDFAWDFGDGSSASGSTPTHSYRARGTYVVTLLVSDGRGGLSVATTRAVVSEPAARNGVPVAVHNGPMSGVIDQPLIFDASGSTDPDDDPVAGSWTFGDGSSDVGTSVLHAYARPGVYTVSLQVTDGRGGASVRSTMAVIGRDTPQAVNHPPVAVAHGPARARGGEAVIFDGRGAHDPDGDPLTLIWVYDDATTEIGMESTHVFITPGNHMVRLFVSDGRGALAGTSVPILVNRTEGNSPPVPAIGGPYAGVVGVPVLFDASGSTEPDGDEMTFAWDFGDGTKGSGPAPSHAYVTAGSFAATLIVSDDNGNAVPSSTRVLIGPPRGPTSITASVEGPSAAVVGRAVALEARASSDVGKRTLQYGWSFGDGSTAVGRQTRHIYAKPGHYDILLIVTDGSGASISALGAVTVREANK